MRHKGVKWFRYIMTAIIVAMLCLPQAVMADAPLTVTKSGTGTGTVTSAPAGINCGSTCSGNFAVGTNVTLTATPDAGSAIASWSGTTPDAKQVIYSNPSNYSLPNTQIADNVGKLRESDLILIDQLANSPSGRSNAAAAALNGKLYIIAGEYGSDTNTLYEYNPATNAWSAKATLPINSSGGAAAASGGKIYYFTGNKTYEYDPSTNTWTQKANAPSPVTSDRKYFAAAELGGLIYVSGGCDNSFLTAALLHVYDPSTNTWTRKADSPLALQYHSTAVLNGIMYAHNGYDTMSYDPSTNTWTKYSSIPVESGTRTRLGVINGKMYGYYTGSSWYRMAFNTTTNTWKDARSVVTPSYSDRYNTAAAVIDNKMYIHGGNGGMDILNVNDPSAIYQYLAQGAISTTAASRINVSSLTQINGITAQTTTPAGTEIGFTVSFDGGSTWKKWNGSAWVTRTDEFDGMSQATLESLTPEQWASTGGFVAGSTQTVDVYVYMKSNSPSKTETPTISNVTLIGPAKAVDCTGSTCAVSVFGDTNVVATFNLTSHVITATASANGSISPSGNVSVNVGANQSFTITPNTGYHVADVLVDGVSVGAVTSYEFTNVTANHTISASFKPVTYAISASAGSGGSITPSGVTNVNHGANQAYTITPNANYQVNDVTVDGVSVGAVTSYEFTNVTANHTIGVSFKPITHTITATAGANGSITPSGSASVNQGASLSFTITPNSNYRILDVLVDGSSVGKVSSYEFTNVTANHTISATFEEDKYVVTVSKDGTGAGTVTSSPAGINCGAVCSFGYNTGTSVTLTATPTTGSTFTGWAGACSGNDVCTVTVDQAKSATATFTINTYAINASAGANGSITPSGITNVNHGGSQTYTITPNENYHVANVTVDGSSVGAVTSYEFTNVTAPHTISATYAINAFTVTATAGSNGNITPSGVTHVEHSGTQAYTITPNAGYAIADVLVDGVSIGAVDTYTFENVTSNHTISATFSVITYTITSSAGENGTISPAGEVTVNHGSNRSFTFTPATGYHVADVLVDGSSVGTPANYTFNNISASHTIAVAFARNTYTINASAGEGGTITPSGTATVEHGATQAYAITANENFTIGGVRIDGVSIGAVDTYTFENVTGNHSIAVTFLRPLPVVNSVTCTETAVAGREVTCTVDATALSGTLAYEWTVGNGTVVGTDGNTATVAFNLAGAQTVTVKVKLVEDNSRFATSSATVTISENEITLTLVCPEQALRMQQFECTATGSVTTGSLNYVFEATNATVTQDGNKATIKPTMSGRLTVKVTANVVETPLLKKVATSNVTILHEGNTNIVVSGGKYPYVNTPTTYTVTAPCLQKEACTVKWKVNEIEETGATLTASFPEPGKYTITAELTMTGLNITRTVDYVVYAEAMPKPIVNIVGPSTAFADEPATYTTTVAARHQVLPVVGQWTLPDGSTVDGSEVTITPDSTGYITLKYTVWVDGYRETTERVMTKRINVVGYVFIEPKIYVRYPDGPAPYSVVFQTKNTHRPAAGAPYKITYNWDFGDGQTLSTTKDTATHTFTKAGSYIVTLSAVDHKENVSTDEVVINAGVPPLDIVLKPSYSNTTMRAPLTAYIRSIITKRSSLDRLESHEWKINNVVQQNTQPDYLRATFSEPGEHTVSYKAVMKSGTVGIQSLVVTAVANVPPECSIDYTDYYPSSKTVLLKAICTDADGRVSSFKWDLDDGKGLRSGFARASVTATESRAYNITLQVTDDAGGVTEVTRAISITR